VVPPLLNLNHAIGGSEIIGHLVDDTISHLRTATGYTVSDITPSQSLDATELTELKSHLRVKDGEGFSGGLSQMKVLKGHYTWICSDHWRERFEQDLQQLKRNVNDNGGVWNGNATKVNVTSEAMTRLFYSTVGKLFRTEIVENRQPWTAVDFEQDSQQLESNSMTDILSRPDDLESLSLDFGRFTMVVKGISRGEVKDVAISIGDLSTLTLEDKDFIQLCRPTALTILGILPDNYDHHLVRILQHNLANLRIECHWRHHVDIIDLVKSTREKMLQNEGWPALRVFQLAHPEIEVKVLFEEGSTVLDVETCIKSEIGPPDIFNPALYCMVRRYGSSVTTFVVPRLFNEALAKLLDGSIQEKSSRITHLDMTPTSLTTPGLDVMNRVIDRSQGLAYLRLSLENLNQNQYLQKALDLLERHKNRLTSLRLAGSRIAFWLPRFSGIFARDAFPVLKEFFVECDFGSSNNGLWIASMVSTPRPQQTSFRAVGINILFDYTQHQEDVIKAIDLSALEELHFNRSGPKGFTQAQLELLVDHIVGSNAPSPPLRLLNLNGTLLGDNSNTRELFARLREKIPDIEITSS